MDSKRLKVKITVSVQLQVELANTNVKSNNVYKKGSYNSTSLQGKAMMSDDFELGGEDEMEAMSSVTFSTQLREVWDMHRRTGEH